MSENHYTIGIQLNDHHALCAYKAVEGTQGLLDRTGGYGRVEVPLQLAYLRDSGSWLIGDEVAAMNFETDTLIENLLLGCLESTSLTLQNKAYPSENLMGYFLHELIQTIYLLNPKAVIEAIRLSFPENTPEVCQEKIAGVFSKMTGVDVSLVSRMTSGVAYIGHILEDEREVLWVDLDEEGLALWLLNHGKALSLHQLREMKEPSFGQIADELETMVQEMYLNHTQKKALTAEEVLNLDKSCQRYLPLIFSKYQEGKALKLTFNQVYPPFQRTLSWETLQGLVLPYMEQVASIIGEVAAQYPCHACFFTGNVFKLQWAKQVIQPQLKATDHLSWQGTVMGLVAQDLLPPVLNFPSKDRKIFGIMVGEGTNQDFLTLVDQEESLVDQSVSIILMVTSDQERLQVLGGTDKSDLKLVAEDVLEARGAEALQRVRVTLSFDGKESPRLQLVSLPL